MEKSDELIRAAMIKKYNSMSIDEIVEDVSILLDKAIQQGFDAGFELAKSKMLDGISRWKREKIMEILKP